MLNKDYDLKNSENYNETYNELSNKKPKKFMKRITTLIVSAAVFGVIAGASFQGFNYIYNPANNKRPSIGKNISETEEQSTVEDNVGDGLAIETGTTTRIVTSDVTGVVDNVMPSIVAINAVINNTTTDFFGRQFNNEVPGSGSGIIIGQNDTEVLIVTNNHVIDNAKTVEIVFVDDTKVLANVKGTEPYSDLAVLSVNINDIKDETIDNIKIATLGDSDSLKLGEMAIAIGNALGYGQSITVGYISALDREVTIGEVNLQAIQTDAAINPGNSGGALLNAKGEVIGINSVKYVDASVESIGYAIPISEAIPVINQLMNRVTLAESEKAYLGISGKDVTDVLAERFSLPIGFYVGEISKGSAAEIAGLKVGDVIVSINGTKVSSMKDLQDILNYTEAGSTGTIIIKSLNNGHYIEKELTVTFSNRP